MLEQFALLSQHASTMLFLLSTLVAFFVLSLADASDHNHTQQVVHSQTFVLSSIVTGPAVPPLEGQLLNASFAGLLLDSAFLDNYAVLYPKGQNPEERDGRVGYLNGTRKEWRDRTVY